MSTSFSLLGLIYVALSQIGASHPKTTSPALMIGPFGIEESKNQKISRTTDIYRWKISKHRSQRERWLPRRNNFSIDKCVTSLEFALLWAFLLCPQHARISTYYATYRPLSSLFRHIDVFTEYLSQYACSSNFYWTDKPFVMNAWQC